VVLSSQRVDLKDAISETQKAKDRAKEVAVDPLVQDGKRLIPSVTRVFGTGHHLYVYFQAYKPPATATATAATPVPAASVSGQQKTAGAQPVVAFVSLYQEGKLIFETQPKSITAEAANRLGTMPLTFDMDVDNLPRGQYDCQVTVLDPATQKAAFWRAPVMLVP
jgi:hypothetical protein